MTSRSITDHATILTGRGLEDSATLDVEAEKEWELEQENMPMDIISSPDSHKVYPVKHKVRFFNITLMLSFRTQNGAKNISIIFVGSFPSMIAPT